MQIVLLTLLFLLKLISPGGTNSDSFNGFFWLPQALHKMLSLLLIYLSYIIFFLLC